MQRAARELLAAARSFLDVAEEMVEDPDRFTGAASQVVDLLRGGIGTVIPGADHSSRLQPWETAAWSASDEGGSTEPWSAEDEDEDAAAEDAESATVDQLFGDTDQPIEAAPAPRRRVRRIAVD